MAHATLDNHDTASSSSTRFLIELAAWVAGPWAAASLAGSRWVAVPVALVLVAVPAVFSTPGDKNQIVVPTPGPTRVLIEVVLLVAAIGAAALVWPWWAALIVALVGIAMLVTGRNRLRWLLAGAPTSVGIDSR